jgi:hypothetical protein
MILRDRGPLRRMTRPGLCRICASACVEGFLHPSAHPDDTQSGGDEASLRRASTGPRAAREGRVVHEDPQTPRIGRLPEAAKDIAAEEWEGMSRRPVGPLCNPPSERCMGVEPAGPASRPGAKQGRCALILTSVHGLAGGVAPDAIGRRCRSGMWASAELRMSYHSCERGRRGEDHRAQALPAADCASRPSGCSAREPADP